MALIKHVEELGTAMQKPSHINSISASSIESGNIFSYINMLHHKDRWIINFGATDHVTMSLDNFVSCNRINDTKVNLPNGTFVIATYKGHVRLSNGIILHNDLYIPEFNYNLISISRLTIDSQVHIVFTNFDCFIQDQTNRKMIC